MWQAIGDTLQLLRRQKGLSHAQLAECVGVSVRAIEAYEADVWRPGRKTLQALAEALGVGIEEIIKGCELLYTEEGEMLVVCHTGSHSIKVVGRVAAPLREEGERTCK